ncbi:MAG: ABC transporter permease [Alphaproteobacteria bacterium]|nr:ABC transporter permease [Alphaproteobacteria bacterium]
MILFLLRRLIGLAATLLAASLVVFIVLMVLPGDPAQVILGVGAQEDTLRAVRAELGLDRPLAERYVRWLGAALTGDLGQSYNYSEPVTGLIAERLAVTVPLALLAIVLSSALALPLGVLAAAHHNRPGDYGVMAFAQLGVAVPNFWTGILLILLFAVVLGWLPAGGFPGWDQGLAAGLGALILPAISLALPQAAILARVARSAMLDVLAEDYMRTARAKGLPRTAAIVGHALRNAMIPVATIMGLQFGFLLAGTVIVEQVFTLPGLGRLAFQAIEARDLVLVQGIVVMLVAMVVTVNFLVDLLYGLLDPRLRIGRAVR